MYIALKPLTTRRDPKKKIMMYFNRLMILKRLITNKITYTRNKIKEEKNYLYYI